MNLTITGHHIEVTPAIRDYVTNKLDRVIRHFDHVTSVTAVSYTHLTLPTSDLV